MLDIIRIAAKNVCISLKNTKAGLDKSVRKCEYTFSRRKEGLMEYITVTEAAKKWGVSNRMVQKYCAEGRIKGVKKFGISWGIPADSVKPRDPRKERHISPKVYACEDEAFKGLMPLMNHPFQPGRCMDFIDGMEDGPQKNIALAEYHYFSGQAEKAAQEAELFLTYPDTAVRLSACLIYGYANLSQGQTQQARLALREIRTAMESEEIVSTQAKAIESFVAAAATVLLHLPLPKELPPLQQLLPALPLGLRAFAMYVLCHYLYLKEDYQTSLGIVEATLAMGAQAYPIPAIYLHLVAVMDCMSLRKVARAEQHLMAAWTLARPDDLIEAFGEHHGLLGGMLEAVIKPQWPEDFKRIINITCRFADGWRKVHNPVTGNNVADNLTTTEFATAMLAARGWTNQEIGLHMNISPNTVKRYLSTSMEKLGITRRKDFKKYMLR